MIILIIQLYLRYIYSECNLIIIHYLNSVTKLFLKLSFIIHFQMQVSTLQKYRMFFLFFFSFHKFYSSKLNVISLMTVRILYISTNIQIVKFNYSTLMN